MSLEETRWEVGSLGRQRLWQDTRACVGVLLRRKHGLTRLAFYPKNSGTKRFVLGHLARTLPARVVLFSPRKQRSRVPEKNGLQG